MSKSTTDRKQNYRDRKTAIILIGLGVCLVILAIFSFLVGRFPISPDKVVGILASGIVPVDQFWTDQEAIIFFNVRLPRVLLAMLVGCSLSAAGAAYQGTFQNPLVSPDILGASQGAAFGAAVAILLGFASFGISVTGMIGWVGLVIPHLSRMLIGSDYRKLMPASMLMGACFLLLVDDVSRLATTAEIPIGILTAFIGAPFFLYLITREGKKR